MSSYLLTRQYAISGCNHLSEYWTSSTSQHSFHNSILEWDRSLKIKYPPTVSSSWPAALQSLTHDPMEALTSLFSSKGNKTLIFLLTDILIDFLLLQLQFQRLLILWISSYNLINKTVSKAEKLNVCVVFFLLVYLLRQTKVIKRKYKNSGWWVSNC